MTSLIERPKGLKSFATVSLFIVLQLNVQGAPHGQLWPNVPQYSDLSTTSSYPVVPFSKEAERLSIDNPGKSVF